jgi:hypothetical protein
LLVAGAVPLVLPATARAQNEYYHHDTRGLGILPPVESPDGPDHGLSTWYCDKGPFIPYWSPLTPLCSRWRPICVVPYYPGLCKSTASKVPPGIYGGWESGPGPLPPIADYNGFNGGPRDETRLLHLGGNGPYAPTVPGALDIIDSIHGHHAPVPHP